MLSTKKFIYLSHTYIRMKISKEDLIRIDDGFGRGLKNSASLEFAIDKQKNEKLGEYKRLAYLFRAILVDHPFSDGNKRTAAYLAFAFASKNNKKIDKDILEHQIQSIAAKNIIEIRAIEERLKSAIK